MAAATLSDHVRVFDGTLDEAACRALIARFEASAGQEICQVEAGYSFMQLDVNQHWPDQRQVLTELFLTYFRQYQVAVRASFWPPRFSFEHVRMKRYLPNGRDGFPVHVDVMGQVAARRFMTAIIYLNEVAGGETVFPTLDMSVAPAPGKLIAFPPLWLFPHAGLPPQSSAKYILHTYLCYPEQPVA